MLVDESMVEGNVNYLRASMDKEYVSKSMKGRNKVGGLDLDRIRPQLDTFFSAPHMGSFFCLLFLFIYDFNFDISFSFHSKNYKRWRKWIKGTML